VKPLRSVFVSGGSFFVLNGIVTETGPFAECDKKRSACAGQKKAEQQLRLDGPG